MKFMMPGTLREKLARGSQVLRQPRVLVLGAGVFLLSIVLGIIVATVSTASQLKATAQALLATGQMAKSAVSAQDLLTVSHHLTSVDQHLTELEAQFGRLAFYRYLPFLNRYYQDGQALLRAAWAGQAAAKAGVAALMPYADLLGLDTSQSNEGAAATNAENRIKTLLQTLELTLPAFDEIGAQLELVSRELGSIEARRYPTSLFGLPLREKIAWAQEMSAMAAANLDRYRPAIEQLSAMAGASESGRQKYLVLFQNDNELRPTGGFLTAYSIIYVEDGVVTPESSDDIYELDKRYRSRLPIPAQLGRYLTTERYWNLRDMNIDPDFRLSMEQFLPEYSKIGDRQIDGVIAVDTELLVRLLEVLGPVKVPGFGTFSAELDPRCDCPQVVYALSEIITRPTAYIREDRKGVLGPLMREILTKAYNAPSEKNAALFKLVMELLAGKHIQFFFTDEQMQAAVETLDFAGRLEAPPAETDFLALVNANLGGAKSNLFTSYQIVNTVLSREGDRLTKELEITFKNSRRGDNCNLEAGLLCLNSTLRDWTRIYLPAGAELIKSSGFTTEPSLYDEKGLRVVDGFFILEPNNLAKLRLTYTIPYQAEDYRLSIWKQGGVVEFPLTINLPGGSEELLVTKDQLYQSPF